MAVLLERRNDAQISLAVVYDVHDSVRLVNDETSRGCNENLDAG